VAPGVPELPNHSDLFTGLGLHPTPHQLVPVELVVAKGFKNPGVDQNQGTPQRFRSVSILHARQEKPDLPGSATPPSQNRVAAGFGILSAFAQEKELSAQEMLGAIAKPAHANLPGERVCAHNPAQFNAQGISHRNLQRWFLGRAPPTKNERHPANAKRGQAHPGRKWGRKSGD
jgi:hypothetical protein